MRIFLARGGAFERRPDGLCGGDEVFVGDIRRGARTSISGVHELDSAGRSRQCDSGEIEQARSVLDLRFLQAQTIALHGAEHLLDAPAQPIELYDLLCGGEFVRLPGDRQRGQQSPYDRLVAVRRICLAHLYVGECYGCGIDRRRRVARLGNANATGFHAHVGDACGFAGPTWRNANIHGAERAPIRWRIEQTLVIGEPAILCGTHNQLDPRRNAGKLAVDVTLPIADDNQLCSAAEKIARRRRHLNPADRFLVLDRPRPARRHPLSRAGPDVRVQHANIWTRSAKGVTARRSRPIEDKESIRWIEMTAAASDLLGSAAQLIVVGDRECDIYCQFARVPPGVELIVRAAQNRRLADDERLFDAPSDWRAFGTMDIRVPPSRPGEAARVAHVSVKAGRVCIAKPRNAAAAVDPATVTLTYVEVRETNPANGHKAIIWRLLTTLPVAGEPDEFAAAQEIVKLYRLRWRIEQVFRAMKSDGLRLEETQIKHAARLFNLAAIALTAAARTIQLVDARDGSSRPASDVADENLIAAAQAIGPTLERATARQKNPHPSRSLAWLTWIIARLGGWNCYYKPPGPKTMRAGWNKLSAMAAGYGIALAQQNA